MKGIETKLETIPQNLIKEMESAGTYDQLKKCWIELIQVLSLDPKEGFGTLRGALRIAATNFLKAESPACDTSVKAIFDDEKLLQELEKMGMSQQFLLQSVRVGALKGYLTQAEQQPGKPLVFFYDPETDIDGFMWANERLKSLALRKKEQNEVQTRLDAEHLQTRKEALMVRLDYHGEMLESDLELLKQLREDVAFALRRLRGFLQASREFNEFLYKNQYQDLNQESYEQIMALSCVQKAIENARQQGGQFPVHFLNPQSRWFHVMKENEVTTLGRLRANLNNNMNDWFKL